MVSLTKTLYWRSFCLLGIIALSACGSDRDVVDSSSSSSSQSSHSSSSNSQISIIGETSVLISELITLEAVSETAVEWSQVKGPEVTWISRENNTAQLITPSTGGTAVITVQANSGASIGQIDITVNPCDLSPEYAFENCIGAGYGHWLAYESSDRQGQIFHSLGEGDYHVQWKQVDSGDLDHGQVMEVTWNANDPENQEAARGWFGLAMPGVEAAEGKDLSQFAEGALSFDMRLIYHSEPNNPAGFITKMECVYPCASSEMPVANGNTSYEWQTHTYPISQLVAGGLDLSKVNHMFVIQPDWFQQEQTVTIQIDNIKLSRTYERPDPAEGCTGAGNVTYTLQRAANPTADQQEAYGLITSAMDVAVENYNCYSNLSRHLTVQYNPSVQTADGSVNGNIRFGARSSMHYVTAMHEIAHTFGAGGANEFRALVVDGVFQGPRATAKLREISGNPSDQLNSDGTHFWPHGLNYISEGGTQQDLIHHCWIVEAMVADMANR